MQKERFTRKQFDNSRDLLRSFVSEFHFSLFDVLDEIEDLRCIAEEDEETGDVFYCFIKHYGEHSQKVVSREMLRSEVESFIFDEFLWLILDDSSWDKFSHLLFSVNGYFSVASLSLYDDVKALVTYLCDDFNYFQRFSFHHFGNISFGSIGKDGHFKAFSMEKFKDYQPTLFYYLRKYGLLQP